MCTQSPELAWAGQAAVLCFLTPPEKEELLGENGDHGLHGEQRLCCPLGAPPGEKAQGLWC